MKFVAKIIPILLLMPMIALGAGELTTVSTFINNIVTFMNGTLVPLVFAIAFLVFLWGMFNESGIFDDTPLFNLLTKIINEAPAGIQRHMIVSTVDTVTGAYLQFDETTPIAEAP